ncbi:MAG: hypothetical protein ACI8P9_000964 [Parasphingorhabdus sp.]|jgi:hypothetical protein
MHIEIHSDGKLSLKDIENFKGFSIIDGTNGTALLELSAIAEPAEERHYWIDADSVIQLSAKSTDPLWVESFWSMLRAVEPYGYADMTLKRVKAHIEPAQN